MDRNHPNFSISGGVLILKARTYRDDDGVLRECGWLFKEVGIENIFDQLILSSDDAEAVPAQKVDELSTLFQSFGGNGLHDPEEPKVGQIEVTFERVILGKTTFDNDISSYMDDNRDADLDSTEVSKKLTHTAARDGGQKRVDKPKTIWFEPLHSQQFAWATFRFYYRSEGRSSRCMLAHSKLMFSSQMFYATWASKTSSYLAMNHLLPRSCRRRILERIVKKLLSTLLVLH